MWSSCLRLEAERVAPKQKQLTQLFLCLMWLCTKLVARGVLDKCCQKRQVRHIFQIIQSLTHLGRMEFTTVINWADPFRF